MNLALIILVLALSGAGLILVGIYLLFGLPITLIAAGVLVFIGAWRLQAGLMPNG